MAHNDPHVRTTGRTPNDPVARPAATSNPNHADPAYRRHEKSGSSWITYALIALAVVLGLMFLMPLFSDDEVEVARTDDAVVTGTVEPVTPTAPAATDDTVVVPEDDSAAVPAPEATEDSAAAPTTDEETNVVTTTVPVINSDDTVVESDAVEQPTQVQD